MFTSSFVDQNALLLFYDTRVKLSFLVDKIGGLGNKRSQTNRGNAVTHSALLDGKYIVTAEDVCSQHHIYENQNSFPVHQNILHFYERKKFQNGSYFVFGRFELTLLDYLSSGNDVQNINQWILELVHGLLGLHRKDLCHGNIHPENIVITDNIAKLHRVKGSGNTNDNIQSLAALMYFCYSGIPYSESYTPTIDDCNKRLLELDFEAYDMVVGLLTSRLQLVDVLMHPKFWDAPKGGQFIQALGDATMDAQGLLLLQLRDLKMMCIVNHDLRGLHYDFVQALGDGARLDHSYRGKIISRLLRVLRNAYHHLTNSDEQKQICFDGDIYKMDWCISEVYPRLVTKAFTELKSLVELLPKFKAFYQVNRP